MRLPRRIARLRVRVRPWRLLLLAAALLVLLPLAGFAWFLKIAAAQPEESPRRTDGIAILTGGAERVETGLRLLLQDRAARLIVSGVHPDATLADLARGASLPVGALAGRVTLGRAARTTRGNAAEIAAWARAEGVHSIRVVTAGYHMPRALLELRRALPEAELLPHPVVPARLRDPGAVSHLRTWSLLAGEYLKLLGAWMGLTRLHAAPSGTG